AETTHGWMQWRKRNGGNLREALANVSLIEAADERQEALAIALVLREALEHQTATAALVTPDRALSRRVRAELMRWNIAIDDSAGDPLALTQAGNLATLALAAAQPAAAPSALQALLDHDAISLGYERGEFIRLRMLASLALFRGLHADISNPAATIAAARSLAEDAHAHTSRKRIAADDWPAMQDLLERLRSALAPLRAISTAIPLTDWMRAHEAVLNELIRPADTSDMEPAGASEDMQALRELFAGFHRTPQQDLPCMSADYASILATLMRETIVRGPLRAHPRLKILGLLEARLLEADVTVLGGLAETIWPPAARTNALLNRQMRAQLGLSSPERRTGQTAHDFVQAMGARRVVLSHARKTGGSPASPSRFLLRLAALAGETAWQECKTRGKNWLDLAGHLDTPERLTLISHPLPRPALALRPQKLSVTAIETWRRDPYSIYAEYILKLTPLDDIDLEEGAAAVGTMLHAALAEFHREFPSGPLPPHAIERLHEYAHHAFAPLFVEPDFEIFKWPRWRKALADFVQWDRERRESNARIFAEIRGELQLPLSDGAFFTLTARADRIEHSPDGSVAVCDYKTGSPPSARQVQSGLSPQLTLEAIMVRDGAFQQIAKAARVDEILYLKISGSGNFEAKDPSQGKEKFNIGEVASKHELGLRELAFQFRDEQTPYLARPVAQFAGRWLRYDHLSRYKEWSAIDGGEE
ncbi:MAG: double-strand break repair protein AddB, partial [Alphaproteobacteria bacterium]|nr:double-strand break repair protein AddB [Alphaproteobacteria bacterium]